MLKTPMAARMSVVLPKQSLTEDRKRLYRILNA